MIIRDINFKQLKNIFELYKQDYKLLNNKFIHNFVYIINGEIVAFLIYSLLYENIEIVDLFVNKKYRKNNIATKLLTKLIKENNNKNITLEVNSKNITAINLYKKVGFEKVATRKGYYDGIDGFLMLKK